MFGQRVQPRGSRVMKIQATRAAYCLATWALVFATAMLPAVAGAQTVPAAPEGPVLLKVSGKIGHANVGQEAHFDLALLEQLGPVTIQTTTIWTEGVQTFTGVPLAAVLAAVEAQGSMIDAWAVNDYWAEIPVAEAQEDGPIIAFAQNGVRMTTRDKGPLWIIYPYDADDAYQSEEIYARSVWQLLRLELRD
jgi:hypothetical protein